MSLINELTDIPEPTAVFKKTFFSHEGGTETGLPTGTRGGLGFSALDVLEEDSTWSITVTESEIEMFSASPASFAHCWRNHEKEQLLITLRETCSHCNRLMLIQHPLLCPDCNNAAFCSETCRLAFSHDCLGYKQARNYFLETMNSTIRDLEIKEVFIIYNFNVSCSY